MPFNYKSYADLACDIALGIQTLPEVDLIVGIPKSGLIPAVMIANFLNCEMVDLDTFLFTSSKRSGKRKVNRANVGKTTRVLVVDDSVNTGRQFNEVRSRLSHFGEDYEFLFCAVYGLKKNAHQEVADYVLSNVEQPRFFQWNYRNHIIAEHALFDLDGVLCVDPTDDQNDDGDLYREFIANARILSIPRKKLSAIVTSRLERFRSETEDWLSKNNVRYGELIMLDLPTASERRRLRAHAPFKAEVYSSRDEVLFVESNWKQARDIARISDKPVICTENDFLLYGSEHLSDLERQGGLYDRESAATISELRREKRALMRGKLGLRVGFSNIRDISRSIFANRQKKSR